MKNSKKWMIQSTLVVSSMLLTAALAQGVKPLVFVSWGGSTQDAQKKNWGDSFTATTKIPVVMDGPTDYGKFKSMVDSKNVQWDVVDVEADFALRAAQQGLLEPLDFKVIDKTKLDPRFVTPNAVGSFYFSFVLGYNTQKVKGKPAGWAALFDTKTYPGKRALYKWPSPGVLELALLADGVNPKQLYPLDLDRAFKKLDSIKSDIIWWGSGAQSQQMLASGEASLGQFWDGRLYALQKDKAPVDMTWNQNLAMADMLVIPKGTKNKDAAMKFIANAVSAAGQAGFDNDTTYSPINKGSAAMIKSDIKPYLATSHQNQQITLNFAYWAKNGPDIARRWNAWLLK